MDLRERLALGYLFISHDLAVVRAISDRVAVAHLGQIVEEGRLIRQLLEPAHPYTQALLARRHRLPPLQGAAAGAGGRAAAEPPEP